MDTPLFSVTVNRELYVTTGNGILKYDRNLNELNSYYGNPYMGIFYNTTNGHLIATVDGGSSFDVFDLNLTFLRTIDATPFAATSFYLHDGRLYSGTYSGFVLVFENEIMIYTFITLCPGYIGSVLVDGYNHMAVACTSNNKVYIYHINGTYMNFYKDIASSPIYMGYDARGKFILTSFDGIYFLN